MASSDNSGVNIGSTGTGSTPGMISVGAAPIPKGESVSRDSTVDQGGRVTESGGLNSEPRRDANDRMPPDPERLYAKIVAASQIRALSPDGEEYLKQMKAIFGEENFSMTRMPDTGAYIVSHPQLTAAIAVVFSEMVGRPTNKPFLPYTSCFPSVYTEAENLDQKHEVLTAILVTPKDYPQCKIMAMKIMEVCRNAISDLTTYSNLDMYRYRVNSMPTQAAIRGALRPQSAHGVLPYVQYGAQLEIAKVSQNRRRYSYNDDDADWIPVLTLGGYTEWVFEDSSRDETRPFSPIVVISACEAALPAINFTPLVLALAYNVFIRSGMYLEPYRSFTPNSGMPNLGRLVPDPETGELGFFDHPSEMSAFLRRYATNPALAVDVTEGRMGFPGFMLLGEPESRQFLIDECMDFDTNKRIHPEDLERLVYSSSRSYTGTVQREDGPCDTRAIDYFCIAESKPQPELLERFSNPIDRPDDRIQAIADAGFSMSYTGGDSLDSVYTTWRHLLDGDSLGAMFEIANGLDILQTQIDGRTALYSRAVLGKIGDTLQNAGSRNFWGKRTDSRQSSYRAARSNAWYALRNGRR